MPNCSYPWPASLINKTDMAVLYQVKQLRRTPITELVAQAVRAYCAPEQTASGPLQKTQLKEAA